MMKKIWLLSAMLIMISASASMAQAYSLVWSDEFDYEGAPDTSKWDYDLGGGGWGNNESQYYTDRTENVRVEDGKLIITARKESYGNNDYTSTRIVSRNKGDWLYCKVEVRAKLPEGRGTWPAIWMLPTDWEYGDWPRSGEIDIMEHVGMDQGTVHGTVHTEAYNHSIGTQKGEQIDIPDCSDAFHVYSMEWTQDWIFIYADRERYFTFYKTSPEYQKWPFDKRFHLLMNIAIGGSWGGQQGIDDSIFPQSMEIDYVRVYKQAPLSDLTPDPDGQLFVYPNPFERSLNMAHPGRYDYAEVHNQLGQLVWQGHFGSSSDQTRLLALDHLQPGIYYLRAFGGEQPVSIRKIVKSR